MPWNLCPCHVCAMGSISFRHKKHEHRTSGGHSSSSHQVKDPILRYPFPGMGRGGSQNSKTSKLWFSIVFCMFTRGYIILGIRVPRGRIQNIQQWLVWPVPIQSPRVHESLRTTQWEEICWLKPHFCGLKTFWGDPFSERIEERPTQNKIMPS